MALTNDDRLILLGLKEAPIATFKIGVPVTSDVIAKLYSNGLLEFEGTGDIVKFSNYSTPWHNYKSNITSISFKEGNTIQPTSTAYLFQNLNKVTSIDLSNLDTSNVIDMSKMFSSCNSLNIITGFENLDTSNVTDVSMMFEYCPSLISLDLSNFDMPKVTTTDFMFQACSNLSSSITIKNSNITSYNGMFAGCSTEPGSEFVVKYIDNDTKSIAEAMVATKYPENSNVFLRSGIVSKAYNIGNPVASDVTATLYDDGCLEFNGSGDISTYASFYDLPWYKDGNYEHIISVLFTYRNNIKPTKIGSLFASLKNTVSINVSNLDTSLVTNMNMLFQRSSSLREIKGLENLNTSNVTNMAYMFESNLSKITLDLSNWDTSKVTSMNSMFSGANNISGSLTIMNPNISYSNMFISTSTASDSQFIVKYIDSNTKTTAQNMVNTKSSNSNVFLRSEIVSKTYEIGNPTASNVVATLYDDGRLEFDGAGNMQTFSSYNTIPWYSDRTSITSVLFKEGNTIQPSSTSYLFYGLSNVTSMDLSNLDTSSVTDMHRMFTSYYSSIIIGLEVFDTSNVTDMSDMFFNCKLNSIDLSGWNTSNVTDMSGMFYNCSTLTSIDLSGWNTSNVTVMNNMFYECSSLTSIDLSGWNTSNVTVMNNMFHGCSSLTSLDLSSFDTSNVTNMTWMFYNCNSLTSLDLSSFDTSNVTNMLHMFKGCTSLLVLDLSSFDTSKVTGMNSMFYNCNSLTSINGLYNFDVSKVLSTYSMFYGCNLLSSSIIIKNTSIKTYSYMFINCSTDNDSKFIVNYTSSSKYRATNAVNTKSDSSNVYLGINVDNIQVENVTSEQIYLMSQAAVTKLPNETDRSTFIVADIISDNEMYFSFSGTDKNGAYTAQYNRQTGQWRITVV